MGIFREIIKYLFAPTKGKGAKDKTTLKAKKDENFIVDKKRWTEEKEKDCNRRPDEVSTNTKHALRKEQELLHNINVPNNKDEVLENAEQIRNDHHEQDSEYKKEIELENITNQLASTQISSTKEKETSGTVDYQKSKEIDEEFDDTDDEEIDAATESLKNNAREKRKADTVGTDSSPVFKERGPVRRVPAPHQFQPYQMPLTPPHDIQVVPYSPVHLPGNLLDCFSPPLSPDLASYSPGHLPGNMVMGELELCSPAHCFSPPLSPDLDSYDDNSHEWGDSLKEILKIPNQDLLPPLPEEIALDNYLYCKVPQRESQQNCNGNDYRELPFIQLIKNRASKKEIIQSVEQHYRQGLVGSLFSADRSGYTILYYSVIRGETDLACRIAEILAAAQDKCASTTNGIPHKLHKETYENKNNILHIMVIKNKNHQYESMAKVLLTEIPHLRPALMEENADGKTPIDLAADYRYRSMENIFAKFRLT